MSFPWIFASNFEGGVLTEWDSETDTDGILDAAHYTELARFPFANHTPYSGAYCARIVPAGGTNDATLTEADINISNTATSHFSFNILFASDFDATSDDTFALLELQGSGGDETVSIGARYVAATDVINMGVGAAANNAAPTAFAGLDMLRNTWYTIESTVVIQTGGTGTANIFITKAGDAAQTTADASVSSITNIVVTDGVFGLQDHLSTTTGTILLDNFVQDDARVFPGRDRFPEEVLVTKDAHVFVGPGKISNVTLMSGGATNNGVTVYDTDEADTNDPSNIVVELKNTSNNEVVDPAGMPVEVSRGAYVVMTGTEPRALVQIAKAPMYSAGAMKIYGLRR